MYKKICDRCGVEIVNGRGCFILPRYKIERYTENSVYNENVHLCIQCDRLFDKWLHEESSNGSGCK